MQLDPQYIPAWERLLARLELPKTRQQWAMEELCAVRGCDTVGCLAHHSELANGYDSTPMRAGLESSRILGIWGAGDHVYDHVYGGLWVPGLCMEDITIDHAIRYVREVIRTRDPMVTVEVCDG